MCVCVCVLRCVVSPPIQAILRHQLHVLHLTLPIRRHRQVPQARAQPCKAVSPTPTGAALSFCSKRTLFCSPEHSQTHAQSTGTCAQRSMHTCTHSRRHRRKNVCTHVQPHGHTCVHPHAEACTLRHMQLRLLRALLPHPRELCDGLSELEFRISINTEIMW